MVGRMEITQALKRLRAQYREPLDNKAQIERDYHGVLSKMDCTPEELSAAVSHIIATREKFFPSVAVVKNTIMLRRPAKPNEYDETPAEAGAFDAFRAAFDKANQSGETFAEIQARRAQPEEDTDE